MAVFATVVLLLVLGLGAVGASYRPNTDIPPGYAGEHVTVKAVPIRVFQSGSGRDVLLIHGSPGSIEDWEPVRSALAGSFHVTAYDRPGHGFSGDSGAYSLEHNADFALALIDALKLDHVIVAGHSYGGATALAMALRDSPRVDAYVVVDSAAYAPSRKADPILRLLALPVVGMGVGTLVGPIVGPSKIRNGLRATFSNGNVSEDFAARRVALWNRPKVTHAIAEETIGAPADLRALSANYAHITRPVFIVAEADTDFRRESAERLHQDISGSSLRLVPETGHFIQFEKTGEVVDAIRRAAGPL
jgi:pimeloyl-ACP methyl ester carboxylesterase